MARNIKRSKLSQQVADLMRQSISENEWHEALPSEQKLGERFCVSRRVVREALETLEKQGVVGPSSRGKKRRIYPAHPATKRSGAQPCVAIVDFMSATFERLKRTSSELAALMEQEGIRVVYPDFIPAASGDHLEAFRELVEGVNVDAWVLVAAPQEICSWAEECGIRAVFAGGDTFQLNRLPHVGYDGVAAAEYAVGHLLSLGHTRIIRPMYHVFRRDDGLNATQLSMSRLFDLHGISWNASYNTPFWDGTETSCHRVIDGTFYPSPPSAFVLTNRRELCVLLSVLNARGLKIPSDVSVIVLAKEELAWFWPKINTFEKNEQAMDQTIVELLIELLDFGYCNKQKSIKLTYLEGASVAACPRPYTHCQK